MQSLKQRTQPGIGAAGGTTKIRDTRGPASGPATS